MIIRLATALGALIFNITNVKPAVRKLATSSTIFNRSEQYYNMSETQRFLASNKFVGKWIDTSLVSPHNPKFGQQVKEFIQGLESGKAYAAYFVASAEGQYVTLGPSFIMTRNSRVHEIFDAIKDMMVYYEESYNIVLSGPCTLRTKCLGSAPETAQTIHLWNSGLKAVRSPTGQIVASSAFHPIPLVNFNSMMLPMDRNIDLRSISPALDGWKMINHDGNSFILERGTSSFQDDSGKTYEQAIESITFNISTGNGTYNNFSKNYLYRFRDTPQAKSINRRTISGAGIVLFYNVDSGTVYNIESRFQAKRLYRTAKISQNAVSVDKTSFVTADIEGLIIDRKHNVPYLAQWFGLDKKDNNIGQVFDYNDHNKDPFKMLQAFWSDLLIRARGRTVYFHNWAGYDAYHSLNALICLAETMNLSFAPLMHNGKLINLKVFQGQAQDKKSLILDIKDSIQLIPGALGKLAKAFNVETLKEHFPHYFDPIKACGSTNYIGPLPSYEYFEPKRTSKKDYNDLLALFPNNDWNFMKESLKYLNADVLAQFQVIQTFFNEIGAEFKFNPIKNCTIPGIAFKAWKGHQYPLVKKNNNLIYDLSQTYDSFLRESYLGGIVDVYKPLVKNGFYYDVNSLYPTAMCKPMPVGDPIFCIPTISEILTTDWFGYLKCTVKAPDNLHIGVLSVRRDGKLITPAGIFTGTFFTEELRYGLAQGYQLLGIEYGYKFRKELNVFKDLISRLNQMKVDAQTSGKPAKRQIAKLLMNSLYGRFGMHPHTNRIEIVNAKAARDIAAAFPIVRTIEFSNGLELIEYKPFPNVESIENGLVKLEDITSFTGEGTVFSETNVPIASAVTAYSRMIINDYKLKALSLGIDVIYSDTDSLVTNGPVPTSWISSSELGLLKLEHVIREGYFIAPKLYYLECVHNPADLQNSDAVTYTVTKSRGYGELLTRAEILSLYRGQSIQVTKHKWYRDWTLHTVYFDMESRLSITGVFSKRSKVFDLSVTELLTVEPHLLTSSAKLAQRLVDEGQILPRWVSTKPLVLNDPVVDTAMSLSRQSVSMLTDRRPIDLRTGSPFNFTREGVDPYRQFLTIQHTLYLSQMKNICRASNVKPNVWADMGQCLASYESRVMPNNTVTSLVPYTSPKRSRVRKKFPLTKTKKK